MGSLGPPLKSCINPIKSANQYNEGTKRDTPESNRNTEIDTSCLLGLERNLKLVSKSNKEMMRKIGTR